MVAVMDHGMGGPMMPAMASSLVMRGSSMAGAPMMDGRTVGRMVAVVMPLSGGGAGGRQRQGGGGRDGQGEDFHGLNSHIPASNHPTRGRRQASAARGRPKARGGCHGPWNTVTSG